ncbi:MAG TPA: phosphotransferase [Blastocatellia bacterium]|nr:phosphotransferase [Blastocatellia bacterium]
MTSPAEMNPSSVISETAARYFNAPAEQISITKLTGDASTRAYYRAQSGGTSVIVALYSAPFDETERAADRLAKLEAANPSARLTFANDPCAHIEVTTLLLKAGLPVPRILASSGDDAVLLIEDVGDVRLQDWMIGRSQEEVRGSYQHAIELIIKIQDATEPALGAGSICSHLAFDAAKLRWELGFFFANYFNRYLHMRLDADVSNAVQQDFKYLCEELAARPRVLTHRDYHARNLMMHDGRMFIIDYQDARMGPASYDVASLVSDPYTTLDCETVNELVERFIELKSKSNLPLADVEGFRRELQLMTVQRMLKAVGTYASQAAIANNPIYIPYIEPAVDRALRAMRSLGRFDATRRLLEQARNKDRIAN